MKHKGILLTVLLLISGTLFSQVIDLRGAWKFHIGDNSSWSSKDFNDASWESIEVPSAWEDQGFNGYDGFAWYRIRFDGRRLNKNEFYYLNLGFIDDADQVFLNGKFVGFSGQLPPKFKTAYNNERRYTLPNDLINFSGMNTIAVRVFDVVHGGGIIDGDIGIYAAGRNNRLLIDLQGIWQFTPSRNEERVKNNLAWENIMVPSPWEYQGYPKYDGFGWYKRTFTIPKDFTKESLVLILGKIDDFDKVYFNGTLIGSTNDHQPFGSSHSYEEVRVYSIPPTLLVRNGINTIEVLVEDTGNIGGIYEGTVGITTRSNYERYFQ